MSRRRVDPAFTPVIGRAAQPQDVLPSQDPDGWLLNNADAEHEESESALPITVVFRTKVAQKNLVKYREWQKGVTNEVSKFDGYLGTTCCEEPPDNSDFSSIFVVVVRFANLAAASCWKESQQRRDWLAKRDSLKLITPSSAKFDFGLDNFMFLSDFDVPNSPRSSYLKAPKVCLVTWLLVWSHVFVVGELLSNVVSLLGGDYDKWSYASMKLPVSIFIVTVILHFVSFPVAMRLLKLVGFL
mmetsp:Transcript_77158/g.136682  ORF Transcript_77158/g.136682 Transcript_77158/m.136682 type:complete len:242 (+) Transcript_77158:64-789(+)